MHRRAPKTMLGVGHDFILANLTLEGPGDIAVRVENGILTTHNVNIEGFHTAIQLEENGSIVAGGIVHDVHARRVRDAPT